MKNNNEIKKLNNKGFSLVELIIVIAIMAVLIGVLAPQYLKYVEKSRKQADLDNFQSIITAVQVYYSDPSNTAVTGTVTVAADGKVTATDSIKDACDDAGVNVQTITMKSAACKNKVLTFAVDATNGTYQFTINDQTLADDLAIGKTN